MKRKIRIYEPSFKPKGHLYMTDDGQIIPSVTEIIKVELNLYQYSSQNAATRGDFVHKACQYYDEKRLKVESLDPIIKPFFDQYLKFLSEHPEVKILQNEVMRYHPKYMFAGRIDKLAEVDNFPATIDIKTCNTLNKEKWHKWQVAAYDEMMKRERGKSRRFVLYLTPKEYAFEEHTSTRDFPEFLALLAAHTIKINNGYIKPKKLEIPE